MNFKIAIVGAALAVFGGIFAVGCGGDDCTAAADDIEAKLETCPDFKPVTTTSTSGTTVECTAALGTKDKCLAACTTAASCECLNFDKSKTCAAADLTTLATCLGKCT